MECSRISSMLFFIYCMCRDNKDMDKGLADFLTLIFTIQKIEFKPERNQGAK